MTSIAIPPIETAFSTCSSSSSSDSGHDHNFLTTSPSLNGSQYSSSHSSSTNSSNFSFYSSHTSSEFNHRWTKRINGNVISIELPLHDNVAEWFNQSENFTLKSIADSAQVKAEVEGVNGCKILVVEGGSSAISKARNLIESRIKQIPVRAVMAVRLNDTTSIFKLVQIPSSGTDFNFGLQNSNSFYIVESPSSSSNDTLILSSTTSSMPYYCPSSAPSSPIFSISPLEEESNPFSTLPSIGIYHLYREEYINSVLNELQKESTEKRIVVRVKTVFGLQLLEPAITSFRGGPQRRSSMDEQSNWNLNGQEKAFNPVFSPILSASTAEKIKAKLLASGFLPTYETSHVHIRHLDKIRGAYYATTCEVRGGSPINLSSNTSSKGTLHFKRCSTIPSKSFELSIASTTLEGEALIEGRDIRVKVLADTAITNPSDDLSEAIKSSTWSINSDGHFNVNINLPENRFTANEVDIKYTHKSRFETNTFRATISEVRKGSKKWYEFEFVSKSLNKKLQHYAFSHSTFNREEVKGLVEEYSKFVAQFVKSY